MGPFHPELESWCPNWCLIWCEASCGPGWGVRSEDPDVYIV